MASGSSQQGGKGGGGAPWKDGAKPKEDLQTGKILDIFA
jgi:hypothetical protein